MQVTSHKGGSNLGTSYHHRPEFGKTGFSSSRYHGGWQGRIPQETVVGLSMPLKTLELAYADLAMLVNIETSLHPALGRLITLCILFAMQLMANSLLRSVS